MALQPDLDATADLTGALLNGRYRVLAAVAEGGMGRIYRAEQHPLGRIVAIKVLHASLTAPVLAARRSSGADETGNLGEAGPAAPDRSFQKRFLLEASLLSRLSHPNLVTVFDFGEVEGRPDTFFMAMEWLEGETLQRRLDTSGPLAPSDAIRIVREIARGLREAHQQHLVHRDLKPANVMLLRETGGGERVKVLDFGLVKVVTGEHEPGRERMTREHAVIGSPSYMSPEQIAQGRVDGRSDLYALGAVLHCLLAGRPPFEAGNHLQIMSAHLHTAPTPLRSLVPERSIPPELEALVLRCLSKAPEQRPASCDELLQELEKLERPTSPSPKAPAGGAAALPDLPVAFGVLDEPDVPASEELELGLGPLRSLLRPPAPVAPPPVSSPRPAPAAPKPGTPLELDREPLAASVQASAAAKPAAPLELARPRPASHPPAGASYGAVEPAATSPTGGRRVARFVGFGLALLAVAVAGPPLVARLGDGVTRALSGRESVPVRIESSPDGAEVYDGDTLLGITPLELELANGELRDRPRRFTIRRAGYAPQTVEQGPSDSPVMISVALEAEGRPAGRSKARPGTK